MSELTHLTVANRSFRGEDGSELNVLPVFLALDMFPDHDWEAESMVLTLMGPFICMYQCFKGSLVLVQAKLNQPTLDILNGGEGTEGHSITGVQ